MYGKTAPLNQLSSESSEVDSHYR